MDFYKVLDRPTKSGVEVYADFVVRPTKDLMIRGGAFYAVWDEAAGLWTTNEYDVQRLVDEELYRVAEKLQAPGVRITVKSLGSYNSKSWQQFRSYVTSIPDNYVQLDNTLAFADTPPKRGSYASKKLPYSVEAGSIDAFDRLMGVLYSPGERMKLEWALGSIVAGDSKSIQKFVVLYGEAGTGKSTFLNITQKLFQGYWVPFDAKAITTSTNAFGLDIFKNNPLLAVQHDGDLSKIDDNTRLNSLVSHEEMLINEKYKSAYPMVISAMLFVGTNQAVRITDAKSGLLRRLIDVHPTGEKIPGEEYVAMVQRIDFELGAIAAHCLAVYRKLGKNFYSSYRPMDMMVRTDIFFNFLLGNYELFKEQDGVTLKQAWQLYKEYMTEAGLEHKMNMHKFRDELRNYFRLFEEQTRDADGTHIRNWFSGFKSEKLGQGPLGETTPLPIALDLDISLLDMDLADCPAQYAKKDETPGKKWDDVKTRLSDLDTGRVHYVRPGAGHVVIDFDLRGDDGEKSLQLNLAAAALWPPTYSELSKSGSGVHLHYLYEGDTTKLSAVFEEGIEVKTFNGNASLRRKLSKCNNIPVVEISSGLPLKETHVIGTNTIQSERGLRTMILRNLHKEFHGATKPSVDFIWQILEDAYNSGMHYDVTDMRNAILSFANGSTNQSLYCVKLVMSMKFASETAVPEKDKPKPADDRLVFYDVEVFPNLLVICWKFRGADEVVKMINPAPAAVEDLIKLKLIGFNNRKYDNHVLYARIMGYTEADLFRLSTKLIANEKNATFSDAYNLSHADIYDFSSKKQGLKRFQIELGLRHQELGLPWDQPVDPALWEKVVEYCANDVITTEQVFESRDQDYVAREVLAQLSGLTVNDTTQRHTAKIIFGDERKPQSQFVYTNLSEQFPGYKYELGKSTYRDEEVGEGGYVYAEPGMYTDVAVLDVASMHPTSIELLNVFGPYTNAFNDLRRARMAIKRRDFDAAKSMLGGALSPYLVSTEKADALAYALKIVINIVYGLTSAGFDNPFRDVRNKDNIVAKRGALFMIDLKHAVQEQGFQVVHIKTDSIKIPNATPDIIDFVMKFGEKYGYDFEHETTYQKFCLVNDAVYIAKEISHSSTDTHEVTTGDGIPGLNDGKWTATGAQFAHPFVFKTLFTKEPLIFDDYVETKTVTAALYLKFGEDEPIFVGRAGAFVPVVEGSGGGLLLRGKEGVFHAATGTKGYFWKEAEVVRALQLGSQVDEGYFRRLADAAKDKIAQFGDYEWFVS